MTRLEVDTETRHLYDQDGPPRSHRISRRRRLVDGILLAIALTLILLAMSLDRVEARGPGPSPAPSPTPVVCRPSRCIYPHRPWPSVVGLPGPHPIATSSPAPEPTIPPTDQE